MPNKLTEYLTKKTGKSATNADVLNTVRSMASENYRADIPELKHLQPINHANIPYANYDIHQNEFFDILINRIGTVLVKALMFENPLGIFRSDSFEYGQSLQELYVHLADKEDFDAKSADSPFMYVDTKIEQFFHDLSDERKYRRTIERAWTVKAFTSENSFDQFIDKMFVSLISSDELDEFEAIKNLIPLSLTPVNVAPPGSPAVNISTPSQGFNMAATDFIYDFNKELIKRSNLFAVPSRTRFENAAQVPNATMVEDQYLLITADFSSTLDSMLANAYNMDKATVLAKKIVVDEFPAYSGPGTLNGVVPFAALISKDSIILKDKLLQLTNIYNPNTLSYNYFYHHHQLISYSLLENARIYYSATT